MLDYSRFVKKRISLIVRVLLLALPVLYIVLILSQSVLAKNTYLINDGGNVTLHSTYSTDPETVLQEIGVHLGEDDIYTTQPGAGLSEITVQRSQSITVLNGAATLRLSSYGETVAQLIQRSNLVLGQYDVLSVPMDAMTYDGMEITVFQAVKRTETYSTSIPFNTNYCYDDSIPKGEQVVLTAGQDGKVLYTATVFYADGKEVSREIVSQVVTIRPTDCLIAIGTKVEATDPVPMPSDRPATKPSETTKPTLPPSNIPSGEQGMPVIQGNTIITPTGEELTFTKRLDCKATAYSCNGVPGITYSGTPARVGAIAVDPSFIPLGSKLYIYTNDGAYIYGVATAEDIGGAIKGNIIDLYFNSFDECWIFGVRECSVFVLE